MQSGVVMLSLLGCKSTSLVSREKSHWIHTISNTKILDATGVSTLKKCLQNCVSVKFLLHFGGMKNCVHIDCNSKTFNV